MTLSDAGRDGRGNIEPTDIEALLPWYAAGTLRRRDRQRVEEALAPRSRSRAPGRSGARRACRNHSSERNARRAAAAGCGPADGGDRCRGFGRAQARAGRGRRLAHRLLRQSVAAHHGGGRLLRRAGDRAAGGHAGRRFHQAGKPARGKTAGVASRIATAPSRWCGSRGRRAPPRSPISCKTIRRLWSTARPRAAFIACGSR